MSRYRLTARAKADVREVWDYLAIERQSPVVLYYAYEDGIEVIGVVHGARDIEGMFRRGER